ncbi:MAG TPA: type II secretion system protein [Polyangiaceae bacterium]
MSARRGFTLLEVMMAVAIVGLGLSVLLGAQTGLFASATRARHISVATGLARCRMSEIELELLQQGFPLIDQESEGNCCMDETTEGYDCAWKVLTVELPEPPLTDGETDGGTPSGLDSEGGESGPMAALMQLQQGVKTPGETPDLGALATEFSGAMSGSDGIASMMMGMVYPSLKPMLQASIRKVVVSVRWREGIRPRTLDVTQYITDPQQAALESEVASGAMQNLTNAFPGLSSGGTSSSGSGTVPRGDK